MTTAMSEEMRVECLRNCTECHQVCLAMLVHPDVVGALDDDDMKLLLNCSQICATSADFLDTSSAYHRDVCGVCTKICTACADMCEGHGITVLRSCAQTCRTCADSCRRMSEMA